MFALKEMEYVRTDILPTHTSLNLVSISAQKGKK